MRSNIDEMEVIGVRTPDKYDKYDVVTTNQVGNGATYIIQKGGPAQGVYEDVVRPEVQSQENGQTLYNDYCEGAGDE